MILQTVPPRKGGAVSRFVAVSRRFDALARPKGCYTLAAMSLLRRLTALCLIVTLVATSGAMAALRDNADGVQRLVICTGMGPQAILIGADGAEIDPAPICPECTMVLQAGPLPAMSRMLPLALPMPLATLDAPQTQANVAPRGHRPRAPPA